MLFNDEPTPDGIRAIVKAHRRFGTTALLPTLISDTVETTKSATRSRGGARGDMNPACWASTSRARSFRLSAPACTTCAISVHPTADDVALLLAPRPGVTVVTLAPEQVPPGFVRQLAGAGVRVCLGHSMASLRADANRHGGRPYGIYPSLQRHASSGKPRARPDRGGAGSRGRLVWHDRGWRACGSGHAASCVAGRGAADVGDRCHATGRRATFHALLSMAKRSRFGTDDARATTGHWRARR